MTEKKELAGLLSQVVRHEYVDKHFARVVIHAVGWPSNGFQPDQSTRYVSYLVPIDELDHWSLGKSLRLVWREI